MFAADAKHTPESDNGVVRAWEAWVCGALKVATDLGQAAGSLATLEWQLNGRRCSAVRTELHLLCTVPWSDCAEHAACCCQLRLYVGCRLALLWIAAHALSGADRSYLLSLILEAITAVSEAQCTFLRYDSRPADDGVPLSAETAASWGLAQHAVLATLTAAAEQVLSSDGVAPAGWALDSIHDLLKVTIESLESSHASVLERCTMTCVHPVLRRRKRCLRTQVLWCLGRCAGRPPVRMTISTTQNRAAQQIGWHTSSRCCSPRGQTALRARRPSTLRRRLCS